MKRRVFKKRAREELLAEREVLSYEAGNHFRCSMTETQLLLLMASCIRNDPKVRVPRSLRYLLPKVPEHFKFWEESEELMRSLVQQGVPVVRPFRYRPNPY
jgi:hypothetical protein